MSKQVKAKQSLDTKSVLGRAKAKTKNRVKVSFTFDADLYERFVKLCESEGAAMSRVLEELMRDLIDKK